MLARMALLLSCLVAGIGAQDTFFVNGQTGVDAPGRGLSAQQPWKTIGYALSQVPPQTPTTSAIVYVEGNQIYSAATNGEVFPLTPVYNVWLEGTFLGHGHQPILAAPTGGAAVVFPPQGTFLRNEVTFRYLVFEGGAYGMRMGAAPGGRHRPRVQDCTFRNQTVAAIEHVPNATSGDDPRFFQNLFQQVPVGILARTAGGDARVAPDVEECLFRDCGTGVLLAVAPTTPFNQRSTVLGQVRSCHFERCGTGIRIENTGFDSYFDLSVTHCRAVACQRGLHVLSQPVYNLSSPVERLLVSDCVVHDCTVGMDFERLLTSGYRRFVLTLARSTVRQCTTGVRMVGDVFNHHQATVEDLWIDGCQTGWRIFERGDPGFTAITARRCMIRDCAVGIDSYLDCEGAWLRLHSSLVVQCRTAALRHHGFPGQLEPSNFGLPALLQLDGVTLADSGAALAVIRNYSQVDVRNAILGGNGADFSLLPNVQLAVNRSCLQGSTWPGAGNLGFTDPQLLRPWFKLAAGSPCVDAGAVFSPAPTTDYEGDARAVAGSPGGAVLPDMGADEFVPVGSARPYGTAGFGAFNVFPRIATASPEARIGQPLVVELSGAIMPVFQVAANCAVLTMALGELGPSQPFDLAAYGFAGAFLWHEPVATAPLQAVTAQGQAAFAHALPNAMALVGTVFTHQWFALMPDLYGVVSSEGLRVTVGR